MCLIGVVGEFEFDQVEEGERFEIGLFSYYGIYLMRNVSLLTYLWRDFLSSGLRFLCWSFETSLLSHC